jgi:hypothetical protein
MARLVNLNMLRLVNIRRVRATLRRSTLLSCYLHGCACRSVTTMKLGGWSAFSFAVDAILVSIPGRRGLWTRRRTATANSAQLS